MMLNEVTMVRSLSPRLLHKGNFGFTTEELMGSIGIRPELAVKQEEQMKAHMQRQLDMEGTAISNPQMFPMVGKHGSVADNGTNEPNI